MASSSGSGASSGGLAQLPNFGSEEDLRALMDQRKAKRMLSNRESARRSRMRKQKHLDELTAQVAHLRKEKGQILTALNLNIQGYFAIDAENSVLRTQAMELNNRLQSLNEILCCMNNASDELGFEPLDGGLGVLDGYLRSPLGSQPVASSDMFQYC